jgi:hypothetical protein
MKCVICNKDIENYTPEFHELKVDNSHSVTICNECVDKIMKWQGNIVGKLFPTTAMKIRYGKS